MSKSLVIVGNGGLAREVKDLILSSKIPYDVLGFVGPPDQNSSEFFMDDNELMNTDEKFNVVIAIGSPKIVQKLYSGFIQNSNLEFPNIIHPSCVISPSVQMGEGNIIFSHVVMSTNTTMGNFNIVYPFNFIGHDVEIGNSNLLTPHCSVSGHVRIGDRCLLGTGSRTIPSISISDDTVVGAGAVITASITDMEGTYVGIPARKL